MAATKTRRQLKDEPGWVSVRVEPETRQLLKRVAASEGRGMSEVIRECVEIYLYSAVETDPSLRRE